MKRRLFWLVAVLGVIAVGISISFLPRCSINKRTFDRIEIGMSEQEVVRLVGKVPKDYSSGPLAARVAAEKMPPQFSQNPEEWNAFALSGFQATAQWPYTFSSRWQLQSCKTW